MAIDQSRPVKTSRSTVGTMTELHDHFKLLFAKIAVLYCRGCERIVERDSPQSIFTKLGALPEGTPMVLTFPLPPPLVGRNAHAHLQAQEDELNPPGGLSSQGIDEID